MKNFVYILLVIIASNLSATIINIPEDQPTIQAGINVAVEGDTVLVAEGTYYENIVWPDIGSIKVIGENRESTIIDGNQVDRVVNFDNDYNVIDETTLLKNFTIRNGYTQYSGAGIYCHNSKPSLINLIVDNNESESSGGGIMCFNYSHAVIENVIFSNNTSSEGGALDCNYTSDATLTNVIFENNSSNYSGGAICSEGGSTISVYYGLISNNNASYGGAIACGEKGSINLVNCTIVENSASEEGGAICTYGGVDMLNCILWNNSFPAIDGSVNAVYSDIQEGLAGEGNINLDPLFVDESNGDYHLTENSPCIDAGDPDSPFDPDDTIADMGVFYYDQLTNANNVLQTQSKLLSNYPNPFNPTTTISFSILNESEVKLIIYNIKGRKIKTLADNGFTQGSHSIIWNGDDDKNKSVSSGVYMYKLKVNGKTEAIRKCLLLK